MSKYSITRSCGHEETIQIYGPVRDRDRKAEYEAGKMCYECYKSEQAKQRAAESVQAAESAKTLGLPQLTGSEKQIAWAESIRAKAAQSLTSVRQNLALAPDDKREAVSIAMRIIDATMARTDAKDWINDANAGVAYDRYWLSCQVKININMEGA